MLSLTMKYILPIGLLLTIFSCKQSPEKTSPVVESISESVYASGVVKSENQYQVYSTVSGLIQEILVNEGDRVKKGDPLMKILNEPSKLNADNARLAADYADLRANQDKLREAKASLDLALTKMKNDSLLYVRQKNMKAKGVGSQVELEQRELAYKNSEFVSNQSKTTLKLYSALAGDYTIRADANAKVYKVLREKGEFVNTLNPVAIVGDADAFLIELKVDEYDIARIQSGQKVVISMDSYKGKVFEGIVSKIEP